eukprot:GEZU01024037.1.p1 GENE.GEZU01024037.1~~GEZU01024037.1.p1  ORF type:complete len:527 (+),score=161.19 GEZU01024037.1:76-1656(+)
MRGVVSFAFLQVLIIAAAVVTVFSVFVGGSNAAVPPVGFSVSAPTAYTLLETNNQSSLYRVESSIDDGRPIYLLDLHGSHYQMGYDMGKLIGNGIVTTYKSFFASEHFKDYIYDSLVVFLDWQFESFLSKQIPQEYVDELNGIRDGGAAIGIDELDTLVKRVITVSNFPGDVGDDIFFLLADEAAGSKVAELAESEQKQILDFIKKMKHHCSFFAVWGSRTYDGSLMTMRNLDWERDTGINQNKLLTVYHPEGKIAHVTVGFAGVLGALTGMSAAGLTVHEAGNDVVTETFLGFTWTLRLRYIMENANNLAEAKALWEQTNNTLGMNHMIASASDVTPGQESHPAYALETMKGYTAYFQDDDPREANLFYKDPKTGQKIQMGFPMKEAIWRTNHGYDPVIVDQQVAFPSPDDNSMIRYKIIHDGFAYYEEAGIAMSEYDAINITAIVGSKGPDFYLCPTTPAGSNIISVTYHPAQLKMYASWEYGAGHTWRPACCATYMEFDMTQWFNSSPANEPKNTLVVNTNNQ